MFGIDQISWGQFARFILTALLIWYLGLILRAMMRKHGKRTVALYEDDGAEAIQPEGLKPISVSSAGYPSGMIPFKPLKDIPLPVSFYEQAGLDEGYGLERFQGTKDPLPPGLLQQIQFQQ